MIYDDVILCLYDVILCNDEFNAGSRAQIANK